MPAASIRTVRLLWERKFRGLYPPASFSLDETGTITLAVPRPLEPRAYDLTVFRPDGGAEVRWGFSVETLIKLETADSDDCVGMTADDLYLFHNHTKSRFLAEKHINYIDCALSAEGERLSTIFSDMAGSSYALAYGDMAGRLIWLREFDSPLTATAISGDGTCIAAADQCGLLTLLDSARREIWQFELGIAVTSVSCSRSAAFTAYATVSGSVGVIGVDGSRIWETALPGEVHGLAISADGSITAVVYTALTSQDGSATVAVLMQDGSIGWTHDTEHRSTGVSLSPDGRVLSVGARDGSIAVYQIEPGTESSSPTSGSAEARARATALEGAGELNQAFQVLQAAALGRAEDADLWFEMLRVRSAYFAAELEMADQFEAQSDYPSAIRRCASVIEADPLYVPAIERLRALRTARARALQHQASALKQAGSLPEAEMCLREAAAVALPEMVDIHRELAQLCQQQAEELDELSAALAAEGRTAEALDALHRAQGIAAEKGRVIRIIALQIKLEFAAGMEAYNAKKYSEAAFQFKKVLNLDSGNSEAKRYLDFSRKFDRDSTQESLADRFSRLE